jgi:hypothetical protein
MRGGNLTAKVVDLILAGLGLAVLLWGWVNYDTKVRPTVDSVLNKVSGGVQNGPGDSGSGNSGQGARPQGLAPSTLSTPSGASYLVSYPTA